MVIVIHKATNLCGKCVAKTLIEAGHQVIAAGDDAEKLASVVAELGPNCTSMIVESPTTRAKVLNALESLPIALSDIDILINDATLSLGTNSMLDTSLNEWDLMIAENCTNLIAMTTAVLPIMLKRNKGTIINIAASLENETIKGEGPHSATAAFVNQYTLDLITSLVNTGVRATCIAPNLPEDRGFSHEGKAAAYQQSVSLTQSAFEIAEAVRWITAIPEHVDLNLMEIAQRGARVLSKSTKQS